MKSKINMIQFLDLVCMSILLPSVPPTILKSGGTLFHLGLMMSLSAATRKFSTLFFNELIKISSREELLRYSLAASSILNMSLFFTSTPTGMLFNRFLFVIIHQVPKYCADLDNSKNRKEEPSIYKNLHLQRIAAVLIGCLVVGNLIDTKGGFYVLVIISTSISAIATGLSFEKIEPVKKDEKKLTVTGAATAIPKAMSNVISSMKDIDVHFANWEALLIKYLLVSNATVVFILYVVLIIVVFGGNGAWVCTTAAYQTITIFISGIIFDKFKTTIDNLAEPNTILKTASIVCVIFAFLTAFSPSYSFYLTMFPFLIISRIIVENYFIGVFELNKNQNLSKDIKTVTAIAEVASPLFIGSFFYLLGYHAYRILMIIPMLVITYIVRIKVNRNAIIQKKGETNDTLKKNKDE